VRRIPPGGAPAALARRIDRLARRAHRFHRFAHHPLCDAYAPEVLRVGRRARVCRGCALAAAGLALGAVVGLALPALPSSGLALAGAAALVLALRGAAPRAGAERSKLASRGLPAALLGALPAHALRHPGAAPAAAGVAALLFAAVALAAYRRRGPDRAACTRCPEGGSAAVCSGYRAIARRERAFARVAARLRRASAT
jgi:hypothetical protein